jgi:hypothetical protein
MSGPRSATLLIGARLPHPSVVGFVPFGRLLRRHLT